MTTAQDQSVTDDVESDPVGRGIYFFHDRTMKLPVRDISDREKNEPYIEYGLEQGLNEGLVIGAENYCNHCYPAAIEQLDKNGEEYLFLITNPKHPEIEPKENQIVGYIRNEKILDRVEDPKAVTGKTKLFRFSDAIPISEFGKRPKGPLGKWGKTFDKEQTEEILSHFNNREEVTEECLEKTLELKENNQI